MVPEVRFEIFPSVPIDTPPIVAVAAVRSPAMVAEDAVSPDVVRAFPEVPTVMPEVLTVVVPTVKVSALTLESVTVLKLGVSETPTVTVPFA